MSQTLDTRPAKPVPKPAKPQVRKKAGGGSLKGELFRQSRIWHGYLSAFAFIALMFFSVTGLLLNHPEWFTAESAPSTDVVVTLTPQELAAAKGASDPMRALGEAASGKTALVGAYKSGEDLDGEALIRFEGIKGASDLTVDLTTGRTEISVQRHDAVTVINELHRGKNASLPWKLVIDLSAILVLILSLIGYILFFSLRFRLRTSLALTGVSLAALVGIFVFLTP